MSRSFEHSPAIWHDFPSLVAGVTIIDAPTVGEGLREHIHQLEGLARINLEAAPESEIPAIQAWRRAYAHMGLKPTQYRCASESLLRRLRTHGSLPTVNPLVDLCNSLSAAYATPVAAVDLTRVSGNLTVAPASGSESYQTFGGEIEHPRAGEIIYADSAGNAHSRRWVTRQSGLSAVSQSSELVLVVAEALHGGAYEDVTHLMEQLHSIVDQAGGRHSSASVLTVGSPVFAAVIEIDRMPLSGSMRGRPVKNGLFLSTWSN